jgi:hypothetical protein
MSSKSVDIGDAIMSSGRPVLVLASDPEVSEFRKSPDRVARYS